MAFVPIRVDRTSKPPIGTPLRTDGHWSVQGLAGAWAFNDGAGVTTFNAVSGRISISANGIGTVGLNPVANSPVVSAFVSSINTRDLTIVTGQDKRTNTGSTSGRASICAVGEGHASGGARLGRPSVNGTELCFVPRCDDEAHRWSFGNNPQWSTIAVTAKSSQLLGYIDGVVSGAEVGSGTWTTSSEDNVYLGCNGVTYRQWGQPIGFIIVYSRAITPSEVSFISANPWQIYEPETVWVEVGGGGEDNPFSGAIYGKSSASANLSTAVVLAAAAQGSSTAQAALSTALELAAQVNGTGSATGALGVDISGLAGSLNGSSEAQATLSTAIHLMGIAAGQCGVVGRLAEPVEILAQLRVMAFNPLALTISVRDPLALRVTVH